MEWVILLLMLMTPFKYILASITDASIKLSSLEPDVLDRILDEKLEQLQIDIFKMYKDELSNHQETLDRLERRKRQAQDDPVAFLPPPTSEFGHSYNFDTGVGNREVVVVDRLELSGYLRSLIVTDVFHLHLSNLTAIYKGEDGYGYAVVDGSLKALKVRNEWTDTTSGCRCDGSGNPTSSSSESCACCVPGACLCQYTSGFNGDTCVPCGTESHNCPKAGTKTLELDAAVGFEFAVLAYGLKQIVITAKSTVVTCYEFDNYGLKVVQSGKGRSAITLEHPVTHLGYGESFVNHFGILKKKRFLITFCAGRPVHQLHELSVGTSDGTISAWLSTIWQATGSVMKASQSGGRLIVTVLDNGRLQIYELKEDLWLEFKFVRIQRISSQNPIITWGTFTTGFENYLYIVSRSSIKIYIQKGIYYNILTTIIGDEDIAGFENLIAINLKSCRDEVVLLAGSGSTVVLYTFDRTIVPNILRKVKVYNLQLDSIQWNLSIGYSLENEVRLVIPGPNRPAIYSLSTHLEEVGDLIWNENLIVANTIRNFNEEYRNQIAIKNAAEEYLLHSVDFNTTSSLDVEITITLPIFSQLLVTNELIAENLSPDGSSVDENGILNRYNISKNKLNLIEDQLNDYKNKLEGAVSTSVTGVQVGGTLTIINPGLNLQTLITNNLQVNTPLNMDGSVVGLEQILRNIVRIGDNKLVRGSKKFINGLTIGELNLKYLDDIPVGDLVLEGGDQNIEGAIYYSIFFAKEINLRPGALIAGIDVTKAVTLNRIAVLGHVIAKDLEVVNNLLISNTVNGIDLQTLFQNALLLTGGEIAGSLSLGREVLISMLDANEIMGIEIDNFLKNAVFKNKDAILNGKLTVGGRTVVNNIRIDGKINNKNLDNYPLRKGNSPIVFRGQKRFSNVKFDVLKFGPQGDVDGIAPRDLVTRTTNQLISGNKLFGQGVQIRQNLEITSKIIDGVNLAEISQGNAQLPSNNPWVFDVVFAGPVTVQSLLHNGLINGQVFSNIASDIVYGDYTVRVTGSKRFLGSLSARNAIINNLLNGEDLSSIITTDRNHIIGGLKTFINNVNFNDLNAVFVDGVNLSGFLSNAVYLSEDGQIITGKKIFSSSVIDNLSLNGKISGVDLNNVLTKSTNQNIIVEQIFSSATFNELNVQSIKLSGFSLNGLDLASLAAKRLPLKTSVDHTGTLIIDGPLSVVGNLMANNINGHDIQDIEELIVKDNENSTINGEVVIQNLVTSGSITTIDNSGANGLSLLDVFLRAVKLTGDNSFFETNFASIEVRGNIDVGGLVNGFNLESLRDDAVYIDLNRRQVVTGNKMFLNGFGVKGNINAETTNGVDLSSRLFTVNTDQHISSDYKFENIVAKSNVFLIGKFNDINLRDLTNAVTSALSRYESINFNGNLKVEELILEGDFDGINILALISDGILIRGNEQFVTGKKSFSSTTQFRSLKIKNLNGIDLDDFFSNVILRNSDNVIIRPLILNGIVTAPWITAENLQVEGSIDRVDYRTLLQDAVYLQGQQNLETELIFEKSIVVKGNVIAAYLNGRSLLGDYLTLHTEQSFTVDSTTATIFSTHIEVGGTVNGLFLPDLRDFTMQVTGGQMITGATTIKGSTKVLGYIEVTGKTGREVKIDLSSEVISLIDGGEINGLVRFTSPLLTSSLRSSSHLINGINLEDLYNYALYKDRPAVVTAHLTFAQRVTLQLGLVVSGKTDGLQIGNLYNTTALILADFGDTSAEIKDEYASMCNFIVSLYDQLEDSLYEGDCFEFIHSEFFSEKRHSSYSFNAFGLTYLIITYEKNCYSEVYLWNNITRSFNFYQSLEATGYAHKWVHVVTEDLRIFLASAGSNTHNNCSDQNSYIWEVSEYNIQRVKVLLPGETVSKEVFAGKHRINVHSSVSTVTFEYNLSGSSWDEVSQSEGFELAVYAQDERGVSVSFKSKGGIGEVWVNGISKQTVDIGFAVNDAVLVNHRNKLILIVVVTVYSHHHYFFELRAYEIDNGKLEWIDIVSLHSPGDLTVFFVGNEACETIYIAITQKNHFPVVYNFYGETWTLWRQMVVPGTTWIQHFTANNSLFPEIMDNYLIFGRNDISALVYYLKMKGSTVPKIENSCEIEEFRKPLLKPVILS